jgi:SAM-dependent methyltransferase
MPVAVIANLGPPDITAYFLNALATYFDRIFALDEATQAATAELAGPRPVEPLSALPEDSDAEIVWFSGHDAWVDDTILAMLTEARSLGHEAYVNRLQLGYTPLISRDRALGRVFARHKDPIGFLAHRSKSRLESDVYLSTTTFDRRSYYLKTDNPAGLMALRHMIEQGTDQRALSPGTHKTTFQVLNQKHMLRMLSRIETFIDLEGKHVLEIGASPKNPAVGAYLAEEKGCHYTGLNIEDFIYPERRNMKLICSDIHQVGFDPGSFDLVFSIAVWEHIPNPLPLFDQIAGWLRPSGIHYGIFQNWTSAIGHHIFAPRFPQHFVPDWAQLLYPTEETMRAALESRGAPQEDARAIAAFTHGSSEINRVASRDFVRTIMGGPLEVLYLDGRTHGRIDPRATVLAEQVPDRTDEEMTCMGLEFALRKSDFDIRAWAD